MGARSRRLDPTAPDRPVSRVLLAEDDDEMRALLAFALQGEGYEVVESASGADLLDQVACFVLDGDTEAFQLIVSDIRMPGVTGLEILEGLSQYSDSPPVILISAFGGPDTADQATKLGAVALLDKPFALEALLDLVHQVRPPPRAPLPFSHGKDTETM